MRQMQQCRDRALYKAGNQTVPLGFEPIGRRQKTWGKPRRVPQSPMINVDTANTELNTTFVDRDTQTGLPQEKLHLPRVKHLHRRHRKQAPGRQPADQGYDQGSRTDTQPPDCRVDLSREIKQLHGDQIAAGRREQGAE